MKQYFKVLRGLWQYLGLYAYNSPISPGSAATASESTILWWDIDVYTTTTTTTATTTTTTTTIVIIIIICSSQLAT